MQPTDQNPVVTNTYKVSIIIIIVIIKITTITTIKIKISIINSLSSS